MKYTNLGKSDLKVSRICMGCMGFGNAATGQHNWTVDEAKTREIIKRGLDMGINFTTPPLFIRTALASNMSDVRSGTLQNGTIM